ncbi:hypothetical protein EKK58_04315 [Candidatus Dependentiae bacterium]|nr:MAG: hypothetical protein EKK58_04315 [Candidatus Dependentiae bacterium]
MNETIRNEVALLLDIDNVKPNEKEKILSICSSFLSSTKYITELKNILDGVFNAPDGFEISSEISRIILGILKLNDKCTYTKNINNDRLKYIIYGVIYSYLIKNQVDFLNSQNYGTFRLLFCNAWDLVSVDISKVIVEKVGCDFCCGLFASKKINIK